MNDQFFTLALKAMDFHGAVDSNTELKMTNSELQKFAELIVKECAKIADEGYASDNFGNGIVGDQLLKHFGMK